MKRIFPMAPLLPLLSGWVSPGAASDLAAKGAVIEAARFPSLQAAFNAVPTNGGVVLLPPGESVLSNSLVLAVGDTRVEGAGPATHLINGNTNGKPALIIRPLQVEVEANEKFYQLEEHLRVLLFQAVRELLFNVVKHAGLLQATVKLSCKDDSSWIMISDPGRGFDAVTVMKDHHAAHGLLIIKDRLGLMGCDMEVHSQPGGGTRIMIGIPAGIIARG